MRTRIDYRRVSKYGSRLAGKTLCIDWRPNQLPCTRLGLTVSSRYGAAHERNLFKRRVREAFRLLQQELPPSLDLNIVPRQRAKEATFADFKAEILALVRQIHVPSK